MKILLQIAGNDNSQSWKSQDSQKQLEPLEQKQPSLARRKASLNTLRQTIADIENKEHVSFLPDLEEFPASKTQNLTSLAGGNLLNTATIHEIWAQKPIDLSAAMALPLSLIKDDVRPFLWVSSRALLREYGLPYGPSLKAAGIDPARFMLVRCKSRQETLWALEEGLKSKALSAVIGEIGQLDLTASRRLVLTARAHNTYGLLLIRSEKTMSTAAYSRWQLSSEVSEATAFDDRAPGDPVLNAQLVKHRGGQRPHVQKLKWVHDAPDSLPVAAPVANQRLVNRPAPHSELSRATG